MTWLFRAPDAERTLRDVVALSTLPAIWLGAEPLRIVESLAASLWTVLEADFVYVALHGDEEHGPTGVVQTGRHHTSPAAESPLGPSLLAWAREHDPTDLMATASPDGAGTLNIAVRPLAIDAEYGLIAVGFLAPRAPEAHHQLLMNVAATQATTAIENIRLFRAAQRLAAQQRTAVREAEAARVQAETASRAKDEFLAMLGHELRNPLAPILTALQLMRLRGDGSAERERTVIERQVAYLGRLVDDLLDVSRIAQGKIELKVTRINISDVVAKAIELASPLIEQRRHRLEVAVPRRGLLTDGDPLRLTQIVSNLLTNAAKYTEPGGLITVTAERAGDEVVLAVRDTGIGISADMLPRVFDLFVQERQTIERSQGGLGLGLSIIRSLVAMHRGRVSVHSDGPGRGSEFLVRLPAACAAEQLDSPAAAAGGAAAIPALPREIRILVVDDNEDAAEMVVSALALQGYTVRAAHDGPSALAVCTGFKPHVALLDIGLPVMDGYELADRLRRLPDMGPLHVCALTGYGQDTDRERSAAAGFHRHFIKPLDLQMLTQVIRELSLA